MKRIIPFVVLLMVGSCFEENECIISATNLVKIDFQTVAGVSQSVTFITVQQDSLGAGMDSTRHFTAYENTINPLASLALPLDPDLDRAFYKFVTSDSIEYHLSLGYSTYARVISTKCGGYLYYENLNVIPENKGFDFDSTRVVSPQLFLSVSTNIKLLF